MDVVGSCKEFCGCKASGHLSRESSADGHTIVQMLAFSLGNKKHENRDETKVHDPLKKEVPNTIPLNKNFKTPYHHFFSCISDYFTGK